MRCSALLLCALAVAVGGCKSAPAKRQPTPLPPELDTGEAAPLRFRERTPTTFPSTLLAAGPAPLVFLFEGGGDIRVVDAGSRQILARATAPPRALISIDEMAGITVAGQKVVPGPLPRGRSYELWWDSRR